MKRLFCFLVVVILLCAVGFGAQAISASSVDYVATASRDSSCQVTVMLTIHIDEATSNLNFPVPKSANSITVNGTSNNVRTSVSGDALLIDLDRILGKVTGDFSLTIHYTLPDVVHFTSGDLLELRLPLMSGFAYPVEEMSFTVTLPGEIEYLPTFESGYHQANIEQFIDPQVNGPTITGTFTETLKDRETVTMKLRVTEKMFPQSLADTQDYTFALYGMAICGGLALVYWLIWLRYQPLRRKRTTEPLPGVTAGETGCVLHLQGVNLHLMAFSWAVAGYLQIRLERGGKVLLQKRMDMGNERKEEERRLFCKLFAKGDLVNTASSYYASLTLSAGGKPMGMRERIHRRTGNLRVFRYLSAGIGLFGGVCVAIAMTGGAFLQVLLILLLGALGGISGYYVPTSGSCVLTPNRHRLIKCGVICGIWLLLGSIAGAIDAAKGMVIGLLVAGIFLANGGRRTDMGKETAAQMLGLRQYLRTTDKLLLQRLCNKDPDYFFNLAPYAISLGVGRTFAKRFGGMRMGGCPYITSGTEVNLNASDWMLRMLEILDRMDERSRKLPMERTIRTVRSMTRR